MSAFFDADGILILRLIAFSLSSGLSFVSTERFCKKQSSFKSRSAPETLLAKKSALALAFRAGSPSLVVRGLKLLHVCACAAIARFYYNDNDDTDA